MAFVSKFSINRLAITGDSGEPIGAVFLVNEVGIIQTLVDQFYDILSWPASSTLVKCDKASKTFSICILHILTKVVNVCFLRYFKDYSFRNLMPTKHITMYNIIPYIYILLIYRNIDIQGGAWPTLHISNNHTIKCANRKVNAKWNINTLKYAIYYKKLQTYFFY